MPFKRRDRHSLGRHIWEMVWPSMGWKRAVRYWRLRIARLDDSPECISIGIASGVSTAFLPIPIGQIVIAAALAAILRGNITASIASTFVANPWTIPLMWYASYRVGIAAYDGMGGKNDTTFPDILDTGALWQALKDHPLELMVPWLVGGAIIGALVWPITYYTCRALVVAERVALKQRKRTKP